MKKNLSKLKKMPLRDVWGHEATDFTQWLSQEENLSFLEEEIGVDIKLIQTEASVGRYIVDILAEEENTGRKIIIENQLEDTNHDHLGKIITYAAGYDASIIIWIVKDCREEHRKAVDWLNEHTDGSINFFLIQLELWQIGNSDPAPKFEIIVSPNEWAKAMKAAPDSGKLTETKLRQLDFWTKFKAHVQAKDTRMKLQTPRPQHWFDVRMGTSEGHVGLTINSEKHLLGCECYIPRNKDLFKFLRDKKSEVEKELGQDAEWIDAPVASRIVIKKEVPDVFDFSRMPEYGDWLYTKTVQFQKVFGRLLKDFSAQQGN